MIDFGFAIAPISLATWSRSSLTTSSPRHRRYSRRMTNASMPDRCRRRLPRRPPPRRPSGATPAPTRSPWWTAGGQPRSSRRRPGRAARCRRPRPASRRHRRSSSRGSATSRSPVPLVVAPDRAQHGGPRLGQHEVAARPLPPALPVVVDDPRRDAGQRLHGRAGLARGDAGQRADHDHAGLGLPPGVDHRAAVAADGLAVPDVGLGVDRLADRPDAAAATTCRTSPGSRRPTS